MFNNYIALEKDSEQANFIKMRIQGIWDCPNQDQQVGAKHINETQRFQMTFREPMEPIDKEARDLVELEDVSEFKNTNVLTQRTDEADEDNPDERANLEEMALLGLLLD